MDIGDISEVSPYEAKLLAKIRDLDELLEGF
jgi:hypothetical protein